MKQIAHEARRSVAVQKYIVEIVITMKELVAMTPVIAPEMLEVTVAEVLSTLFPGVSAEETSPSVGPHPLEVHVGTYRAWGPGPQQPTT